MEVNVKRDSYNVFKELTITICDSREWTNLSAGLVNLFNEMYERWVFFVKSEDVEFQKKSLATLMELADMIETLRGDIDLKSSVGASVQDKIGHVRSGKLPV